MSKNAELNEALRQGEVILQLEKIAKAIAALEGLPIEFHLAQSLRDVMMQIQQVCASR